MKKINLFLAILMTFVIGIASAHAASVTTYITGPSSITPGEQFTVTVGINGGTNIYGVMAAFSYDTDKLELLGSNGANGFVLTLGSNLVVDTSAAQSGNFAIATLTFKAKSSFAIGQSAAIYLSSVEASDGNTIYNGNNTSMKVTVVKPKSANNFLSSLTVDKGTLNFNKNTTSYSIVVDNDVKSITIGAKVEDATATVIGVGTKSLNVYANTFYITVTAENGVKKSYVITVNRKDEKGNAYKLSDDNALSSLVIDGYELKFDKDTFEYDLEVTEDVDELDVNALAVSDSATVKVDAPEKLVIGENVITITVTSENGEERKYTINVFKKENVKNNETKDEKEEKDCKHTAYIVSIIIEGIAIAGLVGYLIYDKKFRK